MHHPLFRVLRADLIVGMVAWVGIAGPLLAAPPRTKPPGAARREEARQGGPTQPPVTTPAATPTPQTSVQPVATVSITPLDGHWIGVAHQNSDLQPFPKEVVETYRLTVIEHRFALRSGDCLLVEGTLFLNSPHGHFDLLRDDKVAYTGIYYWGQGQLHLCFRQGGHPRPEKFAADAGTATSWTVFRPATSQDILADINRIVQSPPAGGSVPPAVATLATRPAGDAGAAPMLPNPMTEPTSGSVPDVAAPRFPLEELQREIDALQGTWSLIAMEENGKKFTGADVPQWPIQIQGTDIKLFLGDRLADQGHFVIWQMLTPKAIRIEYQKQTVNGIYQLDGNTLVICWTNVRARPWEFAAPADSGLTLQVFQGAAAPRAP